MGQVDFDFQPTVPVFDANVALGRRHDRRVTSDTAEGALTAMGRAGVGRAVAYAPHAAAYDPQEGNAMLLELIGDNDNLVPQFACNPTWDDLDEFAAQIKQTGVRSIRMFPAVHNYPFRDWVVGPWLEWAEAEGIPVWIPHSYDLRGQSMVIDPEAVHDTLESHPGVNAVLSEVGYQDEAWAVPLLRSLPNLHVEISRMINTDEISRVTGLLGEERVLFGSRFPDAPILPQLYWLHRCGFDESTLTAICAGNLERLLSLDG